MSKWTTVKAAALRVAEQARAAEARRRRISAEVNGAFTVARADAQPAQPAQAGRRVKAMTATWDGRVLRLTGGNVIHANGRRKSVVAPLAIPGTRIASAGYAVGRVHVMAVDGREYQFWGSRDMAEAITEAIAQ